MKIKFLDPEYKVFNNRVVKCTMICYLDFGAADDFYYNFQIPKSSKDIYSWVGGGISVSVSAVAKCDPEDTFNKITGERIAESKASLKAYNLLYNLLEYNYKRVQESMNLMDDAMDKIAVIANKEVNHLAILKK